jgi:hypothetical protein
VPAESYLFTYPYWIFIDTQDAPVDAEEIRIEEILVRIYPPFRSGAANFIPMPAVDAQAIPFPPGVNQPHIAPGFLIPTMVALPQPGLTDRLMTVWGLNWTEQPRLYPRDSVRIDVVGREDSNLARALSLSLMEYLRWRSGQWWITRSVDGLVGYIRASFPISDNGAALELPAKYTSGRTPRGTEAPITSGMWATAINNLRAQTVIPLHETLTLDAIYFEAVGDLRRSVLDGAAACEHAKDRAFERLWPGYGDGGTYKRGKVMKKYDVGKHISRDLDQFIHRSYAREHPDHFAVIENLWDARGNITHSGQVIYRRNGDVIQVDSEKVKEFILSAEHCISWLEAL